MLEASMVQKLLFKHVLAQWALILVPIVCGTCKVPTHAFRPKQPACRAR